MIVAYCLGVVITFIAVVYASIRNSRLNIVAAIRDIPDVSSPVRKKRTLLVAALALVVAALLTVGGLSGNSAFLAYAGLSILPFGIAMILRYFGVSSRLVYSIVGIYLIVLWLLPDKQAQAIFGELNGDIEMFFLSGIFLVAGSTILIVQNLDVLLGVVNRIGGLFGGALPSVRTAVAFPAATPSRTGMTIAMFSLIIFSLVMFTTINENFTKAFLGDEANAGWDVRADQGGANPIGTSQDFESPPAGSWIRHQPDLRDRHGNHWVRRQGATRGRGVGKHLHPWHGRRIDRRLGYHLPATGGGVSRRCLDHRGAELEPQRRRGRLDRARWARLDLEAQSRTRLP